MKNKWLLDICEKTFRNHITVETWKQYITWSGKCLLLGLHLWYHSILKTAVFFFKDHESIMKRWNEHFTDLIYNPSVICPKRISSMTWRNCRWDHRHNQKIKHRESTIISVDILHHRNNRLAVEVHHVISYIWLDVPIS